MIDGLPAYADYRPSGIPWLGDVPAHWAVQRLKTLASNVTETIAKVHDSSTYIGLKNVESWTGRVATKRIAGSLSGQAKRFPVGAVLFAKLRPYLAKAVCAERAGVCSGEFLVLIASRMVVAQYLGYALRSPGLIHSITGLTAGARMPRAEWDAIGRLVVPRPSLPEQAAIVRFLDWATRRVDRAIRAKRRLVALLTEQKQAIIHRAVTQGLDPSVPMKESGIPWLGEIPAHWEAVRLGRLSTAQCDGPFGSGLKSAHYTDSGVRVIRLQNIGHGEFLDRAPAYISARHYASLGYHDVISGDLLIAGLGDNRIPAGRACVAPPDIGSAMVKADCFRFRLIADRATPHFVALQLSSTAPTASAILSTGATRLRINLSSTAARTIALPPVQEQELVLTSVERLTAPLDATIERTQRQIGLLREYRARLVADVVTGKLDVRAFAETLPDEAPDDIEAVEADVDEDADDDETGDGADEG